MKRANGRGSVEVLSDGRARIRAVIDGKRRQVGPIYPDEATAQRMLAAWNAEVSDNAIVAPGAVTLAALGEEWLDRRELHGSRTRNKVKSIANERSIWRRHVEPSELASMAVQSIRTRDLERFADWLREREAADVISTREGPVFRPTGKPLATKTQKNALGLVRQCLDEAVRLELLPTNPAKLVRVARGGRVANLEDDWLRAEEIEALLSCGGLSLRDRTVYACAIGLALRLNDLKALRPEDVHLDAQVPGPHVIARIAKGDDKLHRVPILPWLVPWLRAHIEALPKGARWLFPAPAGQRYAKDYDFNWPAKLDRAREERRSSALELAGVKRRIRFHDLRGTTATHLALGTWGRTWSLHEIQRMLAHTDQRVTERYVRRALDTLAIAAAATPGGPGTGEGRLPRVAKAASESNDASSWNRWMGRAGLEPATVGLKARCGPESRREVSTSPGQRLGNREADGAGELARAVLLALGAGTPARAHIDALVEIVLASAPEAVRLALAVREGGPHAPRRAIELAALVVAGDAGSDASE